ncbi:MAG: hypothetical protein ACE366_21885 [Bradymonadia bacterium]
MTHDHQTPSDEPHHDGEYEVVGPPKITLSMVNTVALSLGFFIAGTLAAYIAHTPTHADEITPMGARYERSRQRIASRASVSIWAQKPPAIC